MMVIIAEHDDDGENIHLELCEAARLKQAVFQLPVLQVISVRVNMMLMLMLMFMMICYLNERMHISSFM